MNHKDHKPTIRVWMAKAKIGPDAKKKCEKMRSLWTA